MCLCLTAIYAQVDVSNVDLSRLSPEQLKAYKAYVSKSNTSIPSSKESLNHQTIENSVDFSSQNTGIFYPSQKQLPDKNLDLSAPIGGLNDQNKTLESQENIFSTPLDYSDNEEMYKAIQKDKIKKTKIELKKYGENFFTNKNSVNPYAIPTSDNYILTNGDKLSVNIYGQQTNNFELLVDRNGNVEIPNIGIVKVGGLQYGDAKSALLSQLSKAYPQSTVVLDIAYYSTIQVLLTGEVKSPGLYNLPSFATVKDVLMVANGINDVGSYRDIVVKRDGKVVEHFDAYSIIRSGEYNSPILLRNGDVISVAQAKKQVSVLGQVSSPAIFELKSQETFKHLFGYTADFKFDANKNSIKLTRYTNNEKIKIYTLTYEKLLAMKPQNGDVVEVFPLATLGTKMVSLKGNIVQEGEREIPDDAKLSTLLQREIQVHGKQNFFLENTAFDFGMVKRRNIAGSYEIIAFDINALLAKKSEVVLKESDEVYIPSRLQLGENPYIHVSGKVVDKEGRHQYFEKMTLLSLFKNIKFKTEIVAEDQNSSFVKLLKNHIEDHDNNVTKANHFAKTKPVHVNKHYVKLTRIVNNTTEVMALDVEKDGAFKLEPFDRIEFFDIYDTSARYTANISGEVYNPGVFDITQDMNVGDLVHLAGGFTKKAYLKDIEIARYQVVNNERVRNVLSLDLNNIEHQNMKLHDDDQIIVRAIPKWREAKSIEIVGQVRFPGKYPIEDGETIASVIERAGGYTDTAFIKGAVFTRKSVQELQQKEMLKSIQELKQQTAYMASVPSETKESNNENMKLLLAMAETLEKDALKTVPLGRVVIALNENSEKFKQSPYNIAVEDGDKLYVPKVNKTITVIGEVMSSNTFIYDNKLSLGDYIEKAGGYKKESADKGGIYVVKSNGDAERLGSGYFLVSNVALEYGDTIVIPKKIEVTSNMSIISAIADITYKLAVTVASLNTVGAI